MTTILSRIFWIHVELSYLNHDEFSKLIRRKCEGFAFKVSDFKQRSQDKQVEVEQKCPVKRGVELSPSSK